MGCLSHNSILIAPCSMVVFQFRRHLLSPTNQCGYIWIVPRHLFLLEAIPQGWIIGFHRFMYPSAENTFTSFSARFLSFNGQLLLAQGALHSYGGTTTYRARKRIGYRMDRL